MKKFYYDGRSSIDFGMVISGSGTFGAPQRDVEMVPVLGRNGDLIIDNGRYLNTMLTRRRRHVAGFCPEQDISVWRMTIIRIISGWAHSPGLSTSM